MARGPSERVADVRRLLEAARRVYVARASLAPALVEATGLSPEGVELGFASLERDATDVELRALVEAAGDARHVHVVLSANVFVAALRALALAWAAAPRVTVRPSERDPVLARALVEALAVDAVSCVDERDPAASGAEVVHVYGRDATIAQVRASAGSRARVLGHGPGMGVAWISSGAPLEDAASALALDVAAFDQRGCLSPRVAFVEGDDAGARARAEAIHRALVDLDARVPRGRLHADERADATRWHDTIAFAGEAWTSAGHTVGIGSDPLAVPPTGRHLLVVAVRDVAAARRALRPLAHLVVTVGSDDAHAAAALAPPGARVAALGGMQRPPLDGPVDRRTRALPVALT
jgi:hypothetical protein